FGNDSFEVELLSELKWHGIHPIFQSCLLHMHVPTDDILFSSHADVTVDLAEANDAIKWKLNHFISHKDHSAEALFQAEWPSGN
ncbi:uncharacterized protein BT62DRAFT_840659, partial [Guyanagaster necrorhizus]